MSKKNIMLPWLGITWDNQLNLYICSACCCTISGTPNIKEHIKGKSHKLVLQEIKQYSTISQEMLCLKCNTTLLYDLEMQCHVNFHVFKDLKTKSIIDVIQFNNICNNQNSENILKCLLCNKYIKDANILKNHLVSHEHLDRLNFITNVKGMIQIDWQSDTEINFQSSFEAEKNIIRAVTCNVCNKHALTGQVVLDHFQGKKHKKKLISQDIENVNVTDYDCDNIYFPYKCFLCNEDFLSKYLLVHHYKNDPGHRYKIYFLNAFTQSNYMKFKKIHGNMVIYCSICDLYTPTIKTTLDHERGSKHKRHIQTTKINEKKEDKLKTSSEVFRKSNFNYESSCFSASSINHDEINSILSNIIELSFKESKKVELPRAVISNPTRKKFKTNTTHLFSQNVSQFGASYIKLCIDSGEQNIYNIDIEKIRLLKLGVNLIFKFPNYSEILCLPCFSISLKDEQSLLMHLQDQEHLRNLHELEINDDTFKKYPEQFSDLQLLKDYMQDETEDVVYCHACKYRVKNTNNELKLHRNKLDHIKNRNVIKKQTTEICRKFLNIYDEMWYNAQSLLCQICKKRFGLEIEFVKHLESNSHLKKVACLKNKSLEFCICPSCNIFWYGESDYYHHHCNEPFHKRFLESKEQQVPKLTITANDLLSNVDAKIKSLVKQSNETLLQTENEQNILLNIEHAVKDVYPNAKAYIFGSRLSYLGFPDSDVDIFLDCDNLYCNSTSQEDSQNYLKAIKKYFESCEWIIEEIVLDTRVPILKTQHIPSDLKCDISFCNGLGVEKSTLIKYYNTSYSICRELILYLKKWLNVCQLSGSDNITTFAISWYVIFYLQIHGILPSVYLLKNKNETKIIDGWDCSFTQNINASPSSLSFKEHLKEFFTYYANFDYKSNVICPYLAMVIKKHSFAFTEELPEEMNLYKINLHKDHTKVFRYDSPMCIQDPIELSQNITKAVKKLQLRSFRQYCFQSLSKL